jgi:nucleoid-associated protein YgaU
MHLLGPGEVPAALPSVTETPPAVIAPASLTADRWTVKPGECFWTIAESVLHRAWGRPPSEAEIVPYWQRLIAANRSALAHPGDPDLIFPGQVFDVPTP